MIDILEEFTGSGTHFVLMNGRLIGEVIETDGGYELIMMNERFTQREMCDSLHEAQWKVEEVMR